MALPVPARVAGWVLTVAAGAGLAGCTHNAAPSADTIAVTVTRGSCGGAWHAHGGTRTLQITNSGTVTAEVDLISPADGGVYAEIEALAPNTTRSMRLTLARGQYALRCYGEDTGGVSGPTITISDGPTTGTPAVLPVDNQVLRQAVEQYRSHVTAGLTTLATDVDKLRAALRGSDLRAARAAWLTAHLDYERLGAAYGTFGDFADAINGMPDGLPDGVHDKDFTGFHRIEYGLWHGASLASLTGLGDRLAGDVAALRKEFPQQQTDPNDLPLRAHEIMENALQFELTGDSDEGSGTNLATVNANLDGTQMVLNALAPVMKARYPGWPQVATWMQRTRAEVTSAHRPDGSWTPVSALDTAHRQRVDGDVGQLLEVLAPIAAIGDVRRTS